jgi:cytochrome c biogenesis protein CcmG/thiol:disulfide interchange protein DsbE
VRCALAAVLLSSAGGLMPAVAADSLVRHPAPAFTRRDLGGRPLSLRAYRGKVVLLNFWATWCAPCLAEMPRFAAWQTQYGQAGLQVIGISMDDDATAARTTYARLRINYPVSMGDEHLGERYGGVLGLPVTFLIDRRGQVRERIQGETDLHALESRVSALLREH